MLWRKLARDLARSKWQYGAIALMVLLGVAFFDASYAAYVNLDQSYSQTYQALRFESFGIAVSGAPERVADRLRSIDGVVALEGRLIEDCSVEVVSTGAGAGLAIEKKMLGRLITVPVGRLPQVNQLKVVAGRYLKTANAREILLEASFAKFHGIHPGGVLRISRRNSEAKLKVVGVVQSPEYLYVVQSKQQLMAMPDTFGVMFVSPSVLGALVGKSDQLNDFRFIVADSAHLAGAMHRASKILDPYGAQAPVARVDQPSHQMLRQDVEGFRSYAILFPAFFLSVAAVAVYSLLLRMIHQQRPVIGLLRSLGVAPHAIVRHFLSLTLVVGLIGGTLGSVLGVWFAKWTSLLYMSQLQVPFLSIAPRWSVVGAGFAIGLGTCALGGWFPARSAARIGPAEAMRPVAPTYGRSAFRVDSWLSGLSLFYKIPIRNLLRQPRRTASSIFGIVAGIALLMTARGLLDSTDSAIDGLVSGSYQYELRLDLLQYRTGSDVSRVKNWPGVAYAEGVLELPVEMSHEGANYSAMMSGQSQGALLLNLYSEDGLRVRLPSEGAIFGQTLRRRLRLEIGDVVTVAISEQMSKEDSTRRQIRVVGFCESAIGTVAYASRETLEKLFRKDLELPPHAISGILVRADTKSLTEVRQRLLALPAAGSVLSTPEIRKMIKGMMSTMDIFVWIMEAFGAALAFAMLFNMMTINVLERAAEVATMRTIGVSRGQITAMVILENSIVTFAGIAIGLPIGKWFVGKFFEAAMSAEQQDLFTFTVHLRPQTYIAAALIVTGVAMLSQFPALRALSSQNLAKAAKERAT